MCKAFEGHPGQKVEILYILRWNPLKLTVAVTTTPYWGGEDYKTQRMEEEGVLFLMKAQCFSMASKVHNLRGIQNHLGQHYVWRVRRIIHCHKSCKNSFVKAVKLFLTPPEGSNCLYLTDFSSFLLM